MNVSNTIQAIKQSDPTLVVKKQTKNGFLAVGNGNSKPKLEVTNWSRPQPEVPATGYRAPDWQPGGVLPTNGVLPGEAPKMQSFVRVAKLKVFASDAEAYAAGMFLRSVVAREYNRGIDRAAEDYCQRVGLEITNAQHESSGTAGGYAVPSPLASRLIDIRESVGVARRALMVTPMTSNTLSIPKVAGGATVVYPEEMGAITASDKTFAQIGLTARKRAVAAQISQELSDDAVINMADNLFREFGYVLADREDAEFIDGDGGSLYGRVRGLKAAIGAGGISTAASGHNSWATLDLADIMAWIALLPDRFHARNPKIICSSAFYFAVLLRLHAAAGGNTIVSLQGGDGGLRNFLGFDVLTTPYMPVATATSTVHAFFGAFDAGIEFGDRTGVRLARSDDYAFLNDLVTLKATSRYDMQIHDAGTASLPGAYVALATAS